MLSSPPLESPSEVQWQQCECVRFAIWTNHFFRGMRSTCLEVWQSMCTHLNVQHRIVDGNQAEPPRGPLKFAGPPHVSDARDVGCAHGDQTQTYTYKMHMHHSVG